jgi:hypothetical protein
VRYRSDLRIPIRKGEPWPGFGGAIFEGIVGKDNPMDKDHSLFFLGLKANALVHEDGVGRWNRADKKLLLRRSWTHGFLACSIAVDPQSGQV